MRTIAFDPSYNTTGFAVVEGNSRLLAYGVIRSEGKSNSSRYASIMRQVEELCRTYAVEKGVIESPPSFSYHRSTGKDGQPLNFAAIQKCSNATAVILAAIGKLGLQVVEVEAHKWKMYRNRNMNKRQMLDLAQKLFPHLRSIPLSHHEAEAVCLAVANY